MKIQAKHVEKLSQHTVKVGARLDKRWQSEIDREGAREREREGEER